MVEVVSQGRVHIDKRQILLSKDLICAYAHAFVPVDDILNCDAMPGDARLAACHAGRDLNVSN